MKRKKTRNTKKKVEEKYLKYAQEMRGKNYTEHRNLFEACLIYNYSNT